MGSTTNPKGLTEKQPGEITDYDFDFTIPLDDVGDTIASGIVQCADDTLTLNATVVSAKVVKQWVAGGTSGTSYKLECSIDTVGGRTWEAEMWIKVKEK